MKSKFKDQYLFELEKLGAVGLGPDAGHGAPYTLRTLGRKRKRFRKARKLQEGDRKRKTKNKKKVVKVRKSAPLNPWTYGSSQAAGWGGYVTENSFDATINNIVNKMLTSE